MLKKYKNQIVAHRGIHDNITVPENSRKAFLLALEKNYNIELDVHLTKDNFLVVFHDYNLKRMTGKDKQIEDLTLKEIWELKLLKTDEKIPVLEDVLDLVDGKVLLDIEIKDKRNIKKIVDMLLFTLENYTGEVVIKCFNPQATRYLKKKQKKYLVGLLISKDTDKKWYNQLAKTNAIIKYAKADFLAVSKKMLDNKNIKKHIDKYDIMVWTIDNHNEIIKINNKEYIYICNNLM